MTDNKLFSTKRAELLESYAKNGVPFLATTRGLHSVRSLKFDAVNQGAAGAIGFLVARKGQTLNFFAYGQNDNIELSGAAAHRATESDTNLTKAFCTTAASDMSIEWIAAGSRALKVQYPGANVAQWVAAAPDAVVTSALTGDAAMADPFGRVMPVEVGASATLEHVLYQHAAPHLSTKFEWDNADRTEKMGTLDQFTQGTGQSYLRSNGEPSVANRFRIPEGFLWAREGQPASQMQVVCRLEDDIVLPYSPVASPLDATFPVLTAVYLEIIIRVGGMILRVPGSN